MTPSPSSRSRSSAGGADNQLLEPEKHGAALDKRGISYAPDFVANASSVINVYGEVAGWTRERALRKADEIYDTVLGAPRSPRMTASSPMTPPTSSPSVASPPSPAWWPLAAVAAEELTMAERIPIASDHAGFEMKEHLRATLEKMGYEVEDIGTHSAASTDYPDYAHPLAAKVE